MRTSLARAPEVLDDNFFLYSYQFPIYTRRLFETGNSHGRLVVVSGWLPVMSVYILNGDCVEYDAKINFIPIDTGMTCGTFR